jgi:hypothetical protein
MLVDPFLMHIVNYRWCSNSEAGLYQAARNFKHVGLSSNDLNIAFLHPK